MQITNAKLRVKKMCTEVIFLNVFILLLFVFAAGNLM